MVFGPHPGLGWDKPNSTLFSEVYRRSASWSSVSSLPCPYGPLLFASFLIVLYRGRQAYTKLDRQNEILTRLDQEHQAELLAAVAKNRQAVQAFKNTQGEHLLALAKDLKGADAAHLQAIQAQLIPLAFQLQGLATKAKITCGYILLRCLSSSGCNASRTNYTQKA